MEQNRVYYIYRHIRLDKNVPFYIGKGVTTPNAKSYKWEYRRAFYGAKQRNKHWKRIVSKTDYEVNIIFETQDIGIINDKEKEFIKLYGRKGYGTLCNLTDGGDGWSNPPKEIVEKAVKKRKENGTYLKCSISNSRPIYVYNIYGEFIREFKSIREFNKKTYIDCSTVNEYIKIKKSIYGYILSYDKKIEGINVSEYNIDKKHGCPLLKTDWDGTPIILYKTLNTAKKHIGASYCGLKRAVELGFSFRGFYWKHIDIFDIDYYINYGIKYIR